MKHIMRALFKQLFGPRYERIGKSFFLCLCLFFPFHTSGIQIHAAPSVLYLTSAVLSSYVFWQSIHTRRYEDFMQGFFMLPFPPRLFAWSYILSFTCHTLLIRTAPVWALLAAVHPFSFSQAALALLCALSACLLSAVSSLYLAQHRFLLPLGLTGTMLLALLLVQRDQAIASAACLCGLVSAAVLSQTDAHLFYFPRKIHAPVRRLIRKAGAFLLLIRACLSDRTIILNTAGLWAVCALLPFMFRSLHSPSILPLGFAILCLNTPACTLLSADPALRGALSMLPEQLRRFGRSYCLFLSAVHLTSCSIYLTSWQIQYKDVSVSDIWTAFLFCVQSALLSVLLEWYCPIRHCETASDLWHHPRKYIVPLLMLAASGLVCSYPSVILWWSILLPIPFFLLFLPSAGHFPWKRRIAAAENMREKMLDNFIKILHHR